MLILDLKSKINVKLNKLAFKRTLLQAQHPPTPNPALSKQHHSRHEPAGKEVLHPGI